ncbi:MAG: isochorismatase family protein, partial [Thermodesulfobacteriota bacterium]
EIKAEMEGLVPIEKLAFSCCRVEEFNKRLDSFRRRQIILCGIEAHVCILQTAIDLLEKGYEVYVVADGVCSRRKIDWEIGLRYLERRGAMISTTEIIAFQLLKEAGTEEFRRLSKLLK